MIILPEWLIIALQTAACWAFCASIYWAIIQRERDRNNDNHS